MIIRQAKVYGADHHFHTGDIRIENERITGNAELIAADDGEELIGAQDLYAIPGLVDIHMHGAMGSDFCDGTAESFSAITEYEAMHGVLAVCATTMSIPENELIKIAKTASAFSSDTGADIAGINLEGPFVSPKKLGAQNPSNQMDPDIDMVRRINKASGGMVRILDLAPELAGALDCINELGREIVMSLAHTDCSYEVAVEAFDAGAKHLTHMFNAMPPLTHRAPGPIAAASEAGADVELICDGIHVHPSMVRLAFKLFGERVVMISDSMRACGQPDGTYDLGGQQVRVRGNRAELVRDENVIAGGVTNLFDCMKKVVFEMGIPLETAIAAASERPAVSLGIDKDYGSISTGRYGNILLCDKELNIRKIIKKGKVIL